MNALLEHLEKLNAFVIIADSGTVQGAAKLLHTSQPSLSLKLKTLEEALGFQLFTRSKQGVAMTPAGHNLYRFSKRLISDVEHLSLAMDGEHARIRIGTFDIIARMIAPSLCRINSLVDVSFRTERSTLALLDALEKEEIDLAIVDDPPTIPGFQYQKLALSPYGLFATKSFARALPKADEARLAALRHATLVYVTGGLAFESIGASKPAAKMLIDAVITQLGLGAGKRVRLDSYSLALEITLQGRGIGLMLIGHILDELRRGTLVELSHKSLPMPFSSMLYMVTKTGRDRSQIALALTAVEGVFKSAVAAYQTAKSRSSDQK